MLLGNCVCVCVFISILLNSLHYICRRLWEQCTVELQIKDTRNKGHSREKNLSIKDTLRGPFSIILVHFNFRREHNLSIKDKMAGPKCDHYSEVPLYHKSIEMTFFKKTQILIFLLPLEKKQRVTMYGMWQHKRLEMLLITELNNRYTVKECD